MSNNRTMNSVRNILFGSVNRLVSIIFPFIIRTIIIKVLGEEYLGLNSLYSSILQVLNLADLGFASAVIASMYKPIADRNIIKVNAILNLYRKVYRFIGIIILCIGLIITPFITWFINGEPPSGINIYFLWILYLLNTAISYILFAYKVSLLNAVQRYDITEKIAAITKILTGILQIYVVLVYHSIILYVILSVICTIMYNVFCWIISNRNYPEYQCKGKLCKEDKAKIYHNISALAIQKFGNTISLSLDSIVISTFLGLSIVAVYGNYFYIISAVAVFVKLIYASILSGIGNSIAVESIEKNHQGLKKIFFMNTWMIGWCCICLICLLQDFICIWMGEKFLLNIFVVLTLVLRFFIENIRKVVLTYKDAAGMWLEDKWRPLVGCIVNLVLNLILVNKIGVAGVVISTIISYAFIELPWETHILYKYYFKTDTKNYFREMLSSVLSVLIAGITTYIVTTLVTGDQYVVIFVKMITCIIIPNIIFALLNYQNDNFRYSLELISNIYHGLKNSKKG